MEVWCFAGGGRRAALVMDRSGDLLPPEGAPWFVVGRLTLDTNDIKDRDAIDSVKLKGYYLFEDSRFV